MSYDNTVFMVVFYILISRVRYGCSTEVDFARELVKALVPKEYIAIGFHSPFIRQFTEFEGVERSSELNRINSNVKVRN